MYVHQGYKTKWLQRQNREYLNGLAIDIGFTNNPKEYKNKIQLIEKITPSYNNIYLRCYNKTDPCTLEPLTDIPKEYLIEWNQANRHFGADVRSLSGMFENNCTILPWMVDLESTYDISEETLQQYDMKNVANLEDYCKNYKTTTEKKSTSILFEFESIIEDPSYEYGTIINNIILQRNGTKIYKFMYDIMFKTTYHLRVIKHPSLSIYMQYVFQYYAVYGYQITNKKEHIDFLLKCLKNFQDIVGASVSKPIIRMMFMDSP